jgi:hypothetical protein
MTRPMTEFEQAEAELARAYEEACREWEDWVERLPVGESARDAWDKAWAPWVQAHKALKALCQGGER